MCSHQSPPPPPPLSYQIDTVAYMRAAETWHHRPSDPFILHEFQKAAGSVPVHSSTTRPLSFSLVIDVYFHLKYVHPGRLTFPVEASKASMLDAFRAVNFASTLSSGSGCLCCISRVCAIETNWPVTTLSGLPAWISLVGLHGSCVVLDVWYLGRRNR